MTLSNSGDSLETPPSAFSWINSPDPVVTVSPVGSWRDELTIFNSLPPNPKLAPDTGFFSHSNGLVATDASAGRLDSECRPMTPSNVAPAKTPGCSLFDHCTWNFQFGPEDISWRTFRDGTSHTKTRLSFPDDSSSDGSCMDQSSERTPFWCPASSATGDTAFLRSHS